MMLEGLKMRFKKLLYKNLQPSEQAAEQKKKNQNGHSQSCSRKGITKERSRRSDIPVIGDRFTDSSLIELRLNRQRELFCRRVGIDQTHQHVIPCEDRGIEPCLRCVERVYRDGFIR